jgi:hypothetical protein
MQANGRVFFQDFRNMTHTHGIGIFSKVLVKIWKKMHNLYFAEIK